VTIIASSIDACMSNRMLAVSSSPQYQQRWALELVHLTAFGLLVYNPTCPARLQKDGMIRLRIRHVWGHAAVFALSDLVLDHNRKPVCLHSPAACTTRAGGDSGPNFEN